MQAVVLSIEMAMGASSMQTIEISRGGSGWAQLSLMLSIQQKTSSNALVKQKSSQTM